MVNTAPTPVDVVDFQFKLRYRLQVFQNTENDAFAETCSLIASATRFGLLFVGTCGPCFQVLQLQSLNKYGAKDGDVADYNRRTISLPSRPKHLAVNCDCTKLSVVVEKDDCVKAIVFDVPSFLKQNVSVVQEIRLSPTPGVAVVETCWNPEVPSILSVCKNDGSLGVYELKSSGIEIAELPPVASATCMCWSPKGKQIAVGSSDGKITQYKPDLKVARVINAPVLEGAQSVAAVQWISNFQFVAVYKSSNPDVQLNLIVVDCPKVGDTVYTNYEDVCYSYGNARPYQFYLQLQPVWNILMVASSNSIEVGVLALQKGQWTQWILVDSARAELPLSSTKQDTLPVGMAFDTSSSEPYPWGETTLSPMPLVFLLSHHGTLCCFNAVNAIQDAKSVCNPPEQLPDQSGASQFTAPLNMPVVITPAKQIAQQPPPAVSQTFSFNQPAQVTKANEAGQSQPQLIFAAKPTVNQTILKPVQQQPFSLVSNPKPDPQPLLNLKSVEQQVENSVKQQQQQQKPAVVKQSTNEAKSNVPQKPNQFQPAEVVVLNEDMEKMIAQMVREECAVLETELLALLERGRELKIDLGNDSEATNLVQNTNALEVFVNEATETSSSQASEIHSLKQSLIQTWVWYEEARSRFITFKDPKLIALMHAQPLDPASERQLTDIRHLFYYIESQLNQANVALDEQWESFQDSCKKKLHLRMPSIETIYQSMVKQNATVQKQTYILKDLSNRVRRKHRDYQIPHLLVSLENVDNLEEQLKNLQFQPGSVFHLQHERVLKRQKLLTKTKSDKLTNLLLNRKVVHVSVSKPQTLNASLQLNSLIGEPFSPIVPSKKLQPQKLDFVQSTPKTFMKPEPKSASVPVTSEVTKSQIFSLNKPSVSPWGPPSNSLNAEVSSKSTGSAFVPTTQTVSFGIKPSGSSLFSSNNQLITTTVPKPPSTAEQQKVFLPFKPPTTTSIKTTASTSSTHIFTAPVSSSRTNEQKTFSFKQASAPFSFQTVATDAAVKTSSSFAGFNFSANQSSLLKIPAGPSLPKTNSAPAFGSQMTGTSPSEISAPETPHSSNNTAVTTVKSASSFGATVLSSAPSVFAGVQTSKTTAVTNTSLPASSTNATVIVHVKETSAAVSTPASNTTTVSSTETKLTPPAKSIFTLGDEVSVTPVTTSSSVFGGASIFSKPAFVGGGTDLTTKPSTFGNGTASTSIFAKATTSTSSFASNNQTSIFASPAATTTSASIFGGTSKSIFGGSTTSAFSTLKVPVFGASASNIFGATPATAASVFGAPTTSNIFGASTTTITTTPGAPTTSSNIFGASTTSVTTTAPAVFGTPVTSTTSSIFGGASPSVFATPTTSVFGTPPTTSRTSIFGAPTTSTFSSPSTSVFSTPTTSTFSSSTASVFGAPIATTASTTGSVFGAPTTSAGFNIATTPSVFGTTPTTASTVFGTPTTTSVGIFGTPSVSSTAPVFGTPTSSAFSTPTTNIFGAATPTTTATNIFGATPTTTATNIFGGSTTSSNVFGAPNTPSVFGTSTTSFGAPASSIFGGGFKPAVSTASVFGQPSSVFNVPVSTTPGNIFGSTTTSNVFGTPPFGSSGVFGTPTTGASPFKPSDAFGASQTNSFSFAPTSTSSFGFNKPMFGFESTAGSTEPGSFNFGGLNVCSPTATTASSFGSGFGQAQNPFGRTSSEEQKSPFSGGSLFATTASSVFGGSSPFNKSTTAFGGQAAFGSPQGFLQQPAFGQQQQSSFGSGSVFGGSPQPGPFSAGTQSVSQTGFGSSAAFAKPSSGFGGSPAFGAASPGGFGAPPAFGSSPTFGGSTPAFGGTAKVFGGSPSAETFVPAGQQNPTFANLANQPTLGFGSLAQQGQTPTSQSTGFSGGSSFSTWR